MIVEVRSYRIKPGGREEFIEFFETRFMPTLRSHGPLRPRVSAIRVSPRSLCSGKGASHAELLFSGNRIQNVGERV